MASLCPILTTNSSTQGAAAESRCMADGCAWWWTVDETQGMCAVNLIARDVNQLRTQGIRETNMLLKSIEQWVSTI